MITDRSTFATAQENMTYDEQLLALTTKDHHPRLRLYLWPQTSMTYPMRSRKLFQTNTSIDHSPRITGGGILVHHHHDIVWAYTESIAHHPEHHPLKTKLTHLSQWIKHSFDSCNVSLSATPSQSIIKDPTYCLTYESPFELYDQGEKVSGMAIRKFRTTLIVQGIIHLHKTPATVAIPSLQLPQSKGVHSQKISPPLLIQRLFENFNLS